MALHQSCASLEALRKLEARLKADLCAHDARGQDDDEAYHAAPRSAAVGLGACLARRMWLAWAPRLRKFAVVGGGLAAVVFLAMTALWWRLSSGPIALDVATPWLTAAIGENFGDGHQVEIGGTQLERDAAGRVSLRIRDIAVRDGEGTVVASAPKAEVGISGWGLFVGRIRAERLSLVGAQMAVRIESDSQVTVFAGGTKRPFVTASTASAAAAASAPAPIERAATNTKLTPPAPLAAVAPVAAGAATPATSRSGVPDLAALLAWIVSLDAGALDGRDLTEIGLKGGNLTVDDQRNGKQWTFTNIDLSVMRPKGGGIAVALGSEGVERPWQIRATMTPGPKGKRIVDIEAAKVTGKDLMYDLRGGRGLVETG